MQLRRLLAPTDFSTRSELSVKRATLLCRHFNAELQLLHVVDDDQPANVVDQETRQARSLLEAMAAEVSVGLDKEPKAIVKAGDPFQEIVRIAADNGADLIAMGSHRKRILRDVFVGTTIERVMRTGNHPVLMVNSELESSYRRILVATDMSDASANALRTAKTLGFLDDTSVSLIHAFEPLARGMMIYANIEREKIEEHISQELSRTRQNIANFISKNELGDLQYDLRLEDGPTFQSIKSAVDKEQPDLLVIGTRGLSGAKRILLGSVADAVLREVACDILAVPPRP